MTTEGAPVPAIDARGGRRLRWRPAAVAVGLLVASIALGACGSDDTDDPADPITTTDPTSTTFPEDEEPTRADGPGNAGSTPSESDGSDNEQGDGEPYPTPGPGGTEDVSG